MMMFVFEKIYLLPVCRLHRLYDLKYISGVDENLFTDVVKKKKKKYPLKEPRLRII